MLVLEFTRPSVFEHRPSWVDDGPNNTRIDLAPLGSEQIGELAGVLLQKLDVIPAALSALITGTVGGNPFFMEETVKMLLDEGAIVPTASGRWRVAAEKLIALRVPTTLGRTAAALAAASGARDLEAAANLPLGRAETALDHPEPAARRSPVLATCSS